jgi:hypothetical protein
VSPDDLFAAVAVAVVLAGVAVAIAVLRSSGRKRHEKLAPAFELGTSRLVGPFGMTLEGLYRGYTCRYTLQPASQNNPGGASLRVQVAGADRWSAEVVTAGSKLMVRMGLMQDLTIGDPDLDQRLRFAAGDESVLRSTFALESVRTAFHAAAGTPNFAGVRTTDDRVEVKWAPRQPDLDEDVEVLRHRLGVAVDLVVSCGYPPRMGF